MTHLSTRFTFRRTHARALVLACSIPLLGSAPAFAGGMALTMQNGSQLGNTFSGAAAAEDASTIYFNPAGLTRLPHGEVAVTGTYVVFDTAFTNDGSLTAGVLPTTGTNAGDAGVDSVLPTAYIAYPISDSFAVGLGVCSPFGLATEYPDGWAGRYHALKSELKTINVDLAVAWQPTEQLSIGFGLNFQEADAVLTNAIDVGLIGFANSVPGFAPGSADGFVRVAGSDTTTGFDFGVLYSIGDGTRVGFHYRSKMSHSLHGQATFRDISAPFDALFPDQDVSAPLDLPEIISLSFYHDLSSTLALYADWSWWNWSRFSSLSVDFSNPATPDVSLPQNWNDASIISTGVRWRRGEKLTLRAGLAWNETPVPNAEMRSARIPDSDRTWLGLGAAWQFNDNLRGEFGFAHLFMKDARIANDDLAGHVLIGHYKSSASVFSIQLNWGF